VGRQEQTLLQLELLLLIGAALASTPSSAPTFEPQAQISMRRLWRRHQAGLDGLRPAGRANVARARQLFLSAEDSAGVVGHTAGILLEVDEAQDVSPEVRPRIPAMAAPYGATTVYYGTPWDDSAPRPRCRDQPRTRAAGRHPSPLRGGLGESRATAAPARCRSRTAAAGRGTPAFPHPVSSQARLRWGTALQRLAPGGCRIHARQHARARPGRTCRVGWTSARPPRRRVGRRWFVTRRPY
jgi:hypothetical protein